MQYSCRDGHRNICILKYRWLDGYRNMRSLRYKWRDGYRNIFCLQCKWRDGFDNIRICMWKVASSSSQPNCLIKFNQAAISLYIYDSETPMYAYLYIEPFRLNHQLESVAYSSQLRAAPLWSTPNSSSWVNASQKAYYQHPEWQVNCGR